MIEQAKQDGTNGPDGQKHYWGTEDDLVDRLCGRRAIERNSAVRPVVFLVGAALSQPSVPSTADLTVMIRKELKLRDVKGYRGSSGDLGPGVGTGDNPADSEVPVHKQYQQLFAQLYRRYGPEETGNFLRMAVTNAYKVKDYARSERTEDDSRKWIPDDEQCREMEENINGWRLPPGTEALGAIVAEFPDFGHYLLTTNFDPLLAVAIKRARGRVFQTALHGDSNPGAAVVNGCHLIHLHGYWYRDQLHTPERFNKDRSNLREFLKQLIRSHTIVVMGYGGWKDEFTSAVRDVVRQFDATPDILWCVHKTPDKRLLNTFRAGASRGRVCVYANIDCHTTLRKLLRRLRASQVTGSRYTEMQIQESNSLLAKGIWILLSSHGSRYRVTLGEVVETVQSPAPFGRLESAESIFTDDAELGFLKPKDGEKAPDCLWRLRGSGEMLIINNEDDYGLIIPTAHDGVFHWCREKLAKTNRKDSSKLPLAPELCDGEDGWGCKWENVWFDEWAKSKNIDDRARELWSQSQFNRSEALGLTSAAPRLHWVLRRDSPDKPVPTVYVAIHLLPSTSGSHEKYELTREDAVNGYWIKFAAHGGTYVVKLDSNGWLTEWPIFDVTRRMAGRWWIDSEGLHMWLRNWCLTVNLNQNQTPGVPYFSDCWEIEAKSSRRTTQFHVAHVPGFPLKTSQVQGVAAPGLAGTGGLGPEPFAD